MFTVVGNCVSSRLETRKWKEPTLPTPTILAITCTQVLWFLVTTVCFTQTTQCIRDVKIPRKSRFTSYNKQKCSL
jgi:hypothetical protein